MFPLYLKNKIIFLASIYFAVIFRLWSSGRSGGDTGWPDSVSSDNADGKDPSQWPVPAPTSYTDLVPEFEPGKPWRVRI